MVNLYLVRHGETVYNVEHRVQGWSNSPLTKRGVRQAKEAGKKLSGIRFSYAYCGDLVRQKDTADAILAENQWEDIPRVEIDSRLREVSFGGYEEKPEEELLRILAKAINREAAPFSQIAKELSKQEIADLVKNMDKAGTAEGGAEAKYRFCEALLDAAKRAEAEKRDRDVNILVVSSAGVMGMLRETLGAENSRGSLVKNGEVMVLKYTDGKLLLNESQA